ncbi:MoxR family ATPase [Chakrabartyella piscis]|uniref:AAA family ATPase n=1 Tax=Chakrabartyella piscis TaxID=2918914 RepID=UPI00295833EF|nr:MoxR family ATPase [Chakrabartyella piscis]
MELSTKEVVAKMLDETEKIMIGKREQITLILLSILSGGHVLLEDMPGLGKTTLIKTLSIVLGCDFKRIQFTPDLLPSDIVGMNIYNRKTGEFQMMYGPVMTNILLADEINRAIPRTQSALLECMEEQQVTIDGKTHKLPTPFAVMATQNPVESESTFKLPAAQMDRFLIRISLGYPTMQEELSMLKVLGDAIPFDTVNPVVSPELIQEMQKQIETIHVADEVAEYMIALVQKTRENTMLKAGASPRASRALYKMGKAYAAIQGRNFVTPDDIQHIAIPVLAHRVTLSGEARIAKKTEVSVIYDILEHTPVPQISQL